MSVLDLELISAEKSETPLLREIKEMLKSEVPILKANTFVPPIQLVGSSGKTVKMPISVLRALQQMIDYLVREQALRMIPDQVVGVQEAAIFLRVQQSFVEKLLDSEKLPSVIVGTYRLIPRDSLVEYKERVKRERRQALDEMLRLSEETGTLYATMDD